MAPSGHVEGGQLQLTEADRVDGEEERFNSATPATSHKVMNAGDVNKLRDEGTNNCNSFSIQIEKIFTVGGKATANRSAEKIVADIISQGTGVDVQQHFEYDADACHIEREITEKWIHEEEDERKMLPSSDSIHGKSANGLEFLKSNPGKDCTTAAQFDLSEDLHCGEREVTTKEAIQKEEDKNKFLPSLDCEVLHEKSSYGPDTSRVCQDPVVVTIQEKLIVKHHQYHSNEVEVELFGELSLLIPNNEDRFMELQVDQEILPGLDFTMHPRMNKELFRNERIVKAKDPNNPFYLGQTSMIKWHTKNMDWKSLPLIVVSRVNSFDKSICVSYYAKNIVLENLSISIPARTQGTVTRKNGGEYKWFSGGLHWSIPRTDRYDRSGSIDISFPDSDCTAFLEFECYPIIIQFTAAEPFSGLKVAQIIDGALEYIEEKISICQYEIPNPHHRMLAAHCLAHAEEENDDGWPPWPDYHDDDDSDNEEEEDIWDL